MKKGSKKRRRCLRILIIFAPFLLMAGCEKTVIATAESPGDPIIDSAANVVVGRVIDGDTFIFGIGRDSFSVRIIGVDAFETRHGERLDSQASHAHISVDSALARGKEGKRFADSLLSKQNVLLVRDFLQPDFDTYNRLLRHVYYYQGAGGADFGALLLQKGLALVDTL